MTDTEIQGAVAEAARRGLIDVDLADVEPARLAAAVMASPAARSALARLMVGRRTKAGAHGQKPVAPAVVAAILADLAAGMTQGKAATRHGVNVRTVARYARASK